ncbi:hypothetical protein HCH52_03415 [Oscillospiraceae bacterium HV4-5-C5C]|nr:hypothetical protein [Oscillospiraceae bacterium HV4-5-C5C]
MNTIIYISAGLMLIFGVYAVMEHSILRAAIGLALSSASLSVLLYVLGAHLAAVFELSVCSGLVTVIFIAGISLSHSPKMEIQKEYRDKERNRQLPLVLIGAGLLLVILALTLQLQTPQLGEVAADQDVRDVLWGNRQADIWGQIALILCGGVAVAVLFREERREKK